jgi:hypothetical protein
MGTEFLRGREKTGGRRTGSRHRISTALIEAFAEDFETHGAEVIRITRVEKPVEYLKVAVALIPQKIELDEPRQELSDAELDYIESLLERRIASRQAAGREGSQVH